jgi:hypothetical protein
MAVRRLAGDAGKITAFRLETRQLCHESKRESGVGGRSCPAKRLGTTVAKENDMLPLSAFVIALGTVFTSVFWACKEDMADRA